MIYLDNAATTKINNEVLDTMMPYLKENYGNAGTLYSLGRKSAQAILRAREYAANFIGASTDDILFTSGGSESNNLVFSGLEAFLKSIGKKRIVISSVEHDSVIHSVEKMCIKSGFYSTYLSVDKKCRVNIEELKELVSRYDDIGLLSVMYVNNETGAVNDIIEIGKICKENGIFFHTDCVQAAGFNEIDVKKIGCDFLTVSGHKIHAPKGTGLLYVKDLNEMKKNLVPMISGGVSQEFGLRGGTENVAGIVGFGEACRIAKINMNKNRTAIVKMKKEFLLHLCQTLDTYGMFDTTLNSNWVHLNAYAEQSKVINLRFDNIDAQTLVLALDNRGVSVSAGSACRTQNSEPSRVLTQIGLTADEARESIRVSFSVDNTLEEVRYAASIVADTVRTLLLEVKSND